MSCSLMTIIQSNLNSDGSFSEITFIVIEEALLVQCNVV